MKKVYAIKDIYALLDGERAELINGEKSVTILNWMRKAVTEAALFMDRTRKTVFSRERRCGCEI